MLRHARKRVLDEVFSALARAGMDDLGEAHMAVFQHPGPEGMGPLELARRAQMSKQAMNQLLGTLERAGYLARRRDPAHGKQRVIELTDRGWRAIEVIRTTVLRREREIERQLGERRYRTFIECLRELGA